MSDLNPRQEKFISEYLKTLNVTQSAIKAGYSESYAKNRITELLGNVGIKSFNNKLLLVSKQ